jgi:hypothetical protein
LVGGIHLALLGLFTKVDEMSIYADSTSMNGFEEKKMTHTCVELQLNKHLRGSAPRSALIP